MAHCMKYNCIRLFSFWALCLIVYKNVSLLSKLEKPWLLMNIGVELLKVVGPNLTFIFDTSSMSWSFLGTQWDPFYLPVLFAQSMGFTS